MYLHNDKGAFNLIELAWKSSELYTYYPNATPANILLIPGYNFLVFVICDALTSSGLFYD